MCRLKNGNPLNGVVRPANGRMRGSSGIVIVRLECRSPFVGPSPTVITLKRPPILFRSSGLPRPSSVASMSTKRFLEILSVAAQALFVIVAIGVTAADAQGLGGAGTVQGIVKDPTGGGMQAVEVRISNPVSGYSRTTTTDGAGKYVFTNLPPNPYHISVAAEGFQPFEKDVDVRSGVPITLDLSLALAGTTASVDVVGHAEDLLERDPTAHTDID